jgi:hypothetical protein
MVGEFASITLLTVRFSNPILHRLAGDTLDFNDIFLTPTSNELVPDPLAALRRAIGEILLANCTQTTSPARIPALIDAMTLSWQNQNKDWRRLRSANKLKMALKECITQTDTDFAFTAHCDALFFSPIFNGLNLDLVSAVPFPASTQQTSNTTTRSTTTNVVNNSTTTNVFNYNALPSDVLLRWTRHNDPSTIIRVQDMTDLVWADGTRHKYYADPTVIGQSIILLNGSVLAADLDFKKFVKEPPTCLATTPPVIRRWYREFANHALSCGYYVIPYEMLRKGYGKDNGFEFGVDLPASRTPDYFAWQNDIGRLLRKTGTFPSGSNHAKRAASTTNGYHALLALVTDSHPAFVDHPIRLVMNWPKQQASQSIFDFYTEFVDSIRLRAIFLNGSDNFASSHMVDCFLNNCHHASYLIQISRFDRQDPTKTSWFQPGSLPITLNAYLENPDSPTQQASRTPFSDPRGTRTPFNDPRGTPGRFRPRPGENASKSSPSNPFHRRVNELTQDEIDDADEADYSSYVDSAISQLVTAKPNSTKCILCDATHRFSECPIYNNPDFLRSGFIKMVTLVQRQLRDAQRNKNPGSPTDTSQIHQLGHENTKDSATTTPPENANPPTNDTATSHFHPGGK